MPTKKAKTQPRTLTRARLDAAVYALYLKLHDGKARAISATKFIRQQGIGAELLDDLRRIHCVESIGTGRWQRHFWKKDLPPTPQLIDQLERIREERAAVAAARKTEKLRAAAAAAVAATLPIVIEPTPAPTLDDLTTDQLLDFRNTCDKLLKLKTQTRLF